MTRREASKISMMTCEETGKMSLMTREEAIGRLRDHFAIHDDGRPTPYLDEAEHMAIEALEKQIPKKPVWQNEDAGYYFDTGEGWVCICPTCGEYIDEYEHHCKCGQAIDWSEADR